CQHLLGSGQLAGVLQRSPPLGQELEPHLLGRREERGATEQVHGRRNVTAREGSPAGGREPSRSAGAELPILLRRRAQFRAISVRLFQVVADALLVLAGALLEPLRVALVQLAADLLRERVVRGVPDQWVPEAEALLVGEHSAMRTDELLPH